MLSKIQKYLPFIVFAVIILFVVIIFFVFTITPSEEESKEEEVPLAPPPGSSYQVITPEDEVKILNSEKVGQLINKLPYQTQNFSLEYDFSENTFVYWYKKGRKELADEEFLSFLKENGIESQDWLTNLVIQSE